MDTGAGARVRGDCPRALPTPRPPRLHSVSFIPVQIVSTVTTSTGSVGVPPITDLQQPTYWKGVRLAHRSCSHLGGRDTFTHNFAFSKDCFHAENSIKPNSTVTASANQQTSLRLEVIGLQGIEKSGAPREGKRTNTTAQRYGLTCLYFLICFFFYLSCAFVGSFLFLHFSS